MDDYARSKEELIAELTALRKYVALFTTAPQNVPVTTPSGSTTWHQHANLVIDAMRAHVFIKDRGGRHIHVNRALAESTGIPQDAWTGRMAHDLLPQAFRNHHLDDETVMTTGEPLLNIVEPYDSAQGKRWRQTDRVPLRDAEGRVIGLVGLSMDITDHILTKHALRDSEDLLISLLNAVPAGICVTDENGCYTLTNDTYCQIYGFDRDDIIGQHFSAILPPDQAAEEHAWYARLLEGDTDVPTERVRQRRDASLVIVEETNTRLVHANGRRSIITVVRDITRHKQAEAERESLIEDLNAFSHMVAHDLKNPLALVMGYADMLLDADSGDLSSEQQGFVRSILHAGAKIDTIITELLVLAHIRAQPSVEVERLDMAQIVWEARSRLHLQIAERSAMILEPASDDWPAVWGYAPWVEEILANYLSNAVKYGGTPPEIEVGATPLDNGTVRIWVRDDGEGLTPEEQEQLFKPFTRLTHSDRKGHGLGLSIVQRIAERLGGEAGCKSVPDRGSTFWFTLPGQPPTATVQ